MKALKILSLVMIAAGLIFAGCSKMSPVESNFLPDGGGAMGLAKKGVKASVWNVPGDFARIQEAIDSDDVKAGDRIIVGTGNHEGALLTKAVEIKGEDGAVIDRGPAHGSGLSQGFRILQGGSGATISHLQFEVDLAIMNGAKVDNVNVLHNSFISSIQAVSNWEGNGWNISHNVIKDLCTRNGGGIGIFIGCWSGATANDNVVSHNKVNGTLHVWEEDGGGYNGSGIVLYADFRWGRSGADEITRNRVFQNNISLISDEPEVVDVAAFELTDSRDDPNADPFPVIFNNAIGFNNLRGTELQIVLTPQDLDNPVNDISRNLGDNRGHGLHPKVFFK
ncbi:hypothetical protein ACFL40_05460 [candidate division KSB1 bacterium]